MSARNGSSPRPIALLSIAALLIGFAIVEASAFAAPMKPFRADFDSVPDPIPAGAPATITLTISNVSNGTISSSDVFAPNGYALPAQTITLPAGTATVVGGTTIEIRNVSIGPASSLAIAFTAVTPCTGNGPWSLDAKRTGDHSGPVGFALDATGSDLVTDLTGRCHLGFITGPANAELGSNTATQSEPISGAPYDPSGPSVAVEALDGADQRITTSTAPITLTLGGGTGGAVLRLNGSTDVTVPAVQGLASFSQLTVDLVGFGYTITASSDGLDPAASGPFNVVQFGQVCTGATCDSPTATNGSNTAAGNAQATNVSPGDELAIAFAGDDPCAGTGYVPVSPDTFTVLVLDENGQPSEDAVIMITLVVSKEQVKTFLDRGAAHFQVCYATDVEGKTFTDSSGAQVSQGLLPACKGAIVSNCVISKRKDRAGNVTVVFTVLDGRGKT